MTPLAVALLKGRVVSKPDGWDDEEYNVGSVVGLMKDVHCFDVSAVDVIAFDLAEKMKVDGFSPRELFSFLPANNTWIEVGERFISNDDGSRGPEFKVGFLLTDAFDTYTVIEVTAVPSYGTATHRVYSVSKEAMPLHREQEAPEWEFHVLAYLSLINSPRTIGRKSMRPKKTLTRDKKVIIDDLVVHDWVTLELSVSDTFIDDNGVERSVRETGTRCLHYCRAHLRYLNNPPRVSLVKGHWRGDPVKGKRQKRYALTP